MGQIFIRAFRHSYLAALLLITLSASAQNYTKNPGYFEWDGGRFKYGLQAPRRDTVHVTGKIDSIGTVVYRPQDSCLYVKSDSGWAKIGSGFDISGYVPTTRSILTLSPLSGGGDLSADRTLSIADAKADGENKGAATFRSDHFDDDGMGAISLDTVNGPYYTKTQANGRFVHYTDTAEMLSPYLRWVDTTAMLASRWDSNYVKHYAYSKDSSNILYVSRLNTITDGNPVVSVADTLFSFGDSYTEGVGASTVERRYIRLIATKLQDTLINYAVSGTGMFRASKNAFAYIPDSNSTKLITVLAGFNDTWRGEGQFKTQAKIFFGARSIMVAQFTKHCKPASDLTFTGTWSSVNVDTLGGRAIYIGAGGTGRATSAAGDTATYVFSGPNLVVGSFCTDGIIKIARNFQVIVDGISKGTFNFNGATDGISDGTYSNVYMPAQVIVQDLGYGTHTAKIVSMSNPGEFILDFVGTLNAPDDCQPIVFGQTPKLNKDGYRQLFDGYAKVVDSDDMTRADSMIKASIIAAFSGYPVAFAPVSNYANPITDNIYYNVHYNDSGHANIARAFMAVLKKVKKPIYSFSDSDNNLQTVTNNGATTTNTVTVTGSGKLGIGIASPIANLHVNAAGSTGFYLQNTNAIGASSGAFVRLYQNGTPTAANDQLSGIIAGTNSTGTTYETGATIAAKSEAAWTGSSRPTYWAFSTVANGSTALTERLRITAAGNTGVNTAFPTSFLHIRGRMADTVLTVTGNTTLTVNHSTVLVNNSGSVTITLPPASGCAGAKYTIKKISAAANDVIIDPDSAETIDAAATKTLTLQYSSVIMQSNGTNWFILSSHAAATVL